MKLLRFVPSGYNFNRLRGDLFGGLTAGIVALPLALAFGVASGMGAAAGLYGAIALGFFAAIFGGTSTQISGPTGPMTIVVAATIVAFPGDMQSVLAVILVAGALQIGLGLSRLGGFVKFIPYPVVSGFMNGIGVIIILLQFHPLFGEAPVSSPLAVVLGLGNVLTDVNVQALMLSGLTMLVVFAWPARFTRIVPSPLIALVLGTGLAWWLHLDVAVIGDIPSTLPMPSLPSFAPSHFARIIGLGLALAALGTIDSLLTSIVADSLTKEHHDSNRELIGQGIGNMIVGLIGGVAGAGATMRTVVNIKAGGSTRISGVIHASLLLALLLGLGPLAAHIPMAVLAGILVKVGVDIIDYKLLSLIRKAPRADLLVMAVVFFVTVFVDLIVAVGVGVTLAAVMIAVRAAKQCSVSLTGDENPAFVSVEDHHIQKDTDFGIQVLTIRGPFFFGSAASMQNKTAAMLGTKIVVINCLDVPFMDISAIFALSEIVDKLHSAGVIVMLVAQPAQCDELRSLGMEKQLCPDAYFEYHELALAVARTMLAQGHMNPDIHYPVAPTTV